MSELHPQTDAVMAQLEYDHIEGYVYNLKDDLEIIVSHKLGRSRKNPIEDVVDIMNNFLLWEPEPEKPKEGEEGNRPRFESLNKLIHDTANHYRILDHKNTREEPVA